MNHDHAESHDLATLYFEGRLDPETEVEFEQHLSACEVCQERLASDVHLRHGLRDLAREASRPLVLQPGARERSPRPDRSRRGRHRALLAAAALLIFALPMLWWANRSPTPDAPDIVDVTLLDIARNGGERGPQILKMDDAGALLALDAGAPSDSGPFRVEIVNEDGSTIFKKEELRANILEVLLIRLPPSVRAGSYEVILEEKQGQVWVELQRHSFEIVGGGAD